MTELLDENAREQIRSDTASTLFVEAGAGSGKTHALVDRVTTLVLRDGIPLREIAAVTFTEKAGAELRDRLRVEFEKARKGEFRSLADEALDDLDSASIGTLHSFAQQLLLAHPIDAGLPPLIDVLDEVGSSVAFEERWSELQQQLLDDDSIAEPLLLAMAVGVELKHLRSLARLFGNDWDLIGDRVLVDPPELVAMPDLTGLIAAAAQIGATVAHCRDDEDRMLAKVHQVRELGLMLDAATDQETQLAILQSLRALKIGKVGRKENWPDVAKIRSDCAEVVEVAGSLVELLLDACLRHLSHWIAERVLESAELRRAEGRLEFHDLLVLARDLLRRDAAVRSALQERYQRLLLDEFQDTDPIQIELAVRIAGGAEADALDWRDVEVPDGRLFVVGDPKQSIYRFRRANIATYLTAQELLGETVTLTTNFRTVPPVLDWINTVFAQLIIPEPAAQPTYHPLTPHRVPSPTLSLEPEGGGGSSAGLSADDPVDTAPVTGDQLSLLGDSDDVDDAAEEALTDLATVIPLRRHLSVVPAPDATSTEAADSPSAAGSINSSSTAGADIGGSPLAAAAPGSSGAGPAVVVLGAEPHDDLPRAQASVLREREAADVAAVIDQALGEGWLVYDEKAEAWRRAGAGDIAVLVPARTSLPFLEEALDRADIPYRAEASSLVYQTAEVRDLLACARALGDPSDQLALVTALRSPLFGCGDDDLFTWKRSGGSFTLTAPVADSLMTHPVGEAMEWLRRTYYASRWMTPSEVLAKIVADRRMLEVAATGPRARDAWRRVRFVVDQARAWSEVEHGGLRSYLAWAAHQGEEASRVAEAVLPETDADAVRVMTIHAAKGLEFPIVILSGMTAAPNHQRGVQVLWPPDGGYAVKLKKSVQTEDFDLVQPVDEQMDDYERRRLLYVATTRARDHLVVSLHRSGNRRHSSNAELFASAGGVDAANAVLFTSPAVEPRTSEAQSPGSEVAPPVNRAEWTARVTAARQASRRKSAQSASGLEGTGPDVALEGADPGIAKAPRDVELPPWSKGRYGTAIGRAVHGVLQVVDLATGAGLDAAVSSQCLAEGVVEYADVVTALVRSALASDVVQRAAAREHWRESYVGTLQPDGTVLEGFVDLIYREDDGTLVIVDYKTDAIPASALDARVAYYAPQLQSYAAMLPNTGRPVLLFLAPTIAHAHTL
ncbi:PD-(D/E)XK nuclease superfamily protein [Kribbella orskensis]|uniref:DNA 3'-5' helicase n=1 Tax=Kribbella orskensis TaxID=2512216 RepID=A0ABY2BAH8_9ACTN|nr:MULTISPECIES: UvrD-helicase domain-containing protein [Kribbella]TCN33476.1 PD-(D/E)XK nuclease superfamily protein [Kribbella sp. VKM Ac-2500]TCO13622.1 PD-(D/E)XK nuclease superfamily protein [Kribbella orskensis]